MPEDAKAVNLQEKERIKERKRAIKNERTKEETRNRTQ
jgi:hypothetical protein